MTTSRPLRVLVACECSGVVRRAFRALGHDAWSCDTQEAEDGRYHHIKADALDAIHCGPRLAASAYPWDLLIAHPPCTHLSVSGARWFPAKRADGSQQKAIDFFMACVNAPVEHIAVENPVCIMSSLYRKPDQIIQPWQFGHGEVKATCLWLKNLPKLIPTNIVEGRHARVHRMAPGPDRARDRSRTLEGIARAMAAQWSQYLDLARRERREHRTTHPTGDVRPSQEVINASVHIDSECAPMSAETANAIKDMVDLALSRHLMDPK